MAGTPLFSQPYGTVTVVADVPCLLVQWHSFANAPDFIALQTVVLAYLEAHSTPQRPWGLVGDTRHMGAIPVAVQEWLATEFNPHVVAAGVREMSVVVSENIFGQLATLRYERQTLQARDQYALPVAHYLTLEAAKAGARRALAGG